MRKICYLHSVKFYNLNILNHPEFLSLLKKSHLLSSSNSIFSPKKKKNSIHLVCTSPTKWT